MRKFSKLLTYLEKILSFSTLFLAKHTQVLNFMVKNLYIPKNCCNFAAAFGESGSSSRLKNGRLY